MAHRTQVSVRELKTDASEIVRRVEAGERVTITKRGRVVAVIAPAGETPRSPSDSIYQRLRRHIEIRSPGLRHLQDAEVRRDFERLSRKAAKAMRFKDWREMDRALKGDRFGLSR